MIDLKRVISSGHTNQVPVMCVGVGKGSPVTSSLVHDGPDFCSNIVLCLCYMLNHTPKYETVKLCLEFF